jgi:hypothetical protein
LENYSGSIFAKGSGIDIVAFELADEGIAAIAVKNSYLLFSTAGAQCDVGAAAQVAVWF